jgi:CHAT domain-containing protein/tetratricopeptide (TPR) repeat protein
VILRLVCFSFAVLLISAIACPTSEPDRLEDYLRSQISAASRLLTLARALCPKEEFGDYIPLAEVTVANYLKHQPMIEMTDESITAALLLPFDGLPEKAVELSCTTLKLRAEALGVLDPRTFAAFQNLALILRQGGRAADARMLSEEMLPIVRHYPDRLAQRTRAVMNSLGTALYEQGFLPQAEALFREYLDNAERLGQMSSAGVAMSNLARLLDQQERFEEAETWHRRVVDLRVQRSDREPGAAAASYTTLGENLTSQGKYADGEKALRQALEIYSQRFGPNFLNTSLGLRGLAQNLLLQGRATEALPLAQRSLLIQLGTLGPGHPHTATSYYQLSRIELALGHADASLENARAALRARLPLSRREEAALNLEGRAHVRQNVGSAAFQFVAAAWHALGQGVRQGSKAQEMRNEAFLAMQRIPLSDTGEAFSQAAARKMASRSGLASVVSALEASEDRLRWLDTMLAQSATAPRDRQEGFTAMKAEQVELGEEIRALNEQLKSKFPDYLKQAREEPLSLDQVRWAQGGTPLIGANEALVIMTPGSGTERGYIWAVSREQVGWAQLRVAPDVLKKEIAHLLGQLDVVGRGVKLDDRAPALHSIFDRKTAFDLYDQLFGDAQIQEVVRSKSRWIIVAQGALLATPFNALVVTPPAQGSAAEDRDPSALRATHWLGLERALSFLPSVSNLSTSRRTGPSRAPASALPLFAMGDPVFMPASGGNPYLSKVYELRRLPGTRTEIDILVRTLNARQEDVLLDTEATETKLKERSQSGMLERAKVVVFATHGLVAGTLPGSLQEPALVLTQPRQASAADDGLLTASEAAQLRFDADWIVLSACNTAGSATADGEGLTGLARAFLFAGGRALLVSQWRLDDDSAPLLTSGTLDAASGRSPMSRADSLRESMRRLMNDTSHDGSRLTRAHPAVWAPMILVGSD